MNSSIVSVAEELLKESGFNPGPADGVITSETAEALRLALKTKKANLPRKWESWPPSRMVVAWIQASCLSNNINSGPVDGLWGPSTEHAFESLTYLRRHGKLPEPWRDDRPVNSSWPLERESELTAFYGSPGQVSLSNVVLPYSIKAGGGA